MIERLLIANRGEIACRILRTCGQLGMLGVAVYTEEERGGRWVREADEAFLVPSYLDQHALIQGALRAGVQAVHPGFGFLAENADFARAVQGAGLIWVGPTPESMELLASKEAAKQLAHKEGVPVLTSLSPESPRFPLMIKALAGGGGKGMRRVDRPEELEAALQSARSEAGRSFGDDRVLLEPLLNRARHIEVQVLGDQAGNLIHLGERDCSLQRRHQKILEETPAVGLPPELPARLHEAALKVARAAGYRNAGTVEFLVSGDQFYFLEMNTRLQVEHPVTEMVSRLDLVEWQLRLARGEQLPELPGKRFGHAVEVRLYAEDPAQGHLPGAGQVLLWESPSQVRVESALLRGEALSPSFDPMVAKLVAWGEDRPEALRKLRRALERTILFGVASNRDFLHHWLGRAEVETFHVDTLDGQTWTACLDPWAPWAAAAARRLQSSAEAWRNLPGEPPPLHFEGYDPIVWDEPPCGLDGDWLWLEREGQRRRFRVLWTENECWVASHQSCQKLTLKARRSSRPQSNQDAVLAPLTGSIVEVLVQAGDRVQAGQTLLRLEAMKMDHRLNAPGDGVVEKVLCAKGEVVQARSLLVKLKPGAQEPP